MLLLLYRFVAGWLQVEFYGSDVSRFLNLCTRHEVALWNVRESERGKVDASMYVRDLYALRPVFRKTHVRFRIRRRRGLPFLLHRYRKRKVFLVVLFCAMVAIGFLSSRIWRIEFVGNTSLSEDTLLNYLNEREISYGTGRASIDNDALELSLRQDFDPIIWASVYEKGTKLVVCIQEKIASDRNAVKGSGEPMDLVATKDAKIVSVITRKGIGAVKAGETVQEGDLLVSGKQEILDDNGEVRQYYYETADADVIGKVVYDYEDWIALENVITRRTGQKHVRYFVRFGAHQFTTPIFYADYDSASVVEENRQLCLMESFYLPVYTGTITEYEQQKQVQKLDFADAKSLALEHLDHFLTNLEQNGVSIIDKNVMIEKIELKYHIYGKVTAEESITKQRPTKILPDPVASTTEQEEQ